MVTIIITVNIIWPTKCDNVNMIIYDNKLSATEPVKIVRIIIALPAKICIYKYIYHKICVITELGGKKIIRSVRNDLHEHSLENGFAYL